MLGNITNNPLLTGDSVNQNENVNGIGKTIDAKNQYAKTAEFNDSLEVSDEAKALLQREQDIEFFKSLVLDSPNSQEEMKKIMELIQSGEFIDNKELAEAMREDNDLLQQLFSGIGAVS